MVHASHVGQGGSIMVHVSQVCQSASLIVPVRKVGQVENFMVHVFPKIALAGSLVVHVTIQSVNQFDCSISFYVSQVGKEGSLMVKVSLVGHESSLIVHVSRVGKKACLHDGPC